MAIWSAIPILGQILDKVLPDRSKINDAQARINEAEVAGAPASHLRLWRSALGWVLAAAFAWEVIGRPIVLTYWPGVLLPPSVLGEVSKILLAMLGLGW